MQDTGLSYMEFKAVEIENNHQIKKWGYQNVDPHKWLGYLTEEVGELAEAINKIYSDYDKERVEEVNIYKEAIQVATLALKIAKMRRQEQENDKNRESSSASGPVPVR